MHREPAPAGGDGGADRLGPRRQPQLIGRGHSRRRRSTWRPSISRRSATACGRWSTAPAPPAAASCRSRASKWAARPAPPRCGASPAGQRGQGGDWKYRDHGLFVFFAPVDAPRYAGSVVIDHGMGGARAAAPVAKDVLTYLFDKPEGAGRLAPARGSVGRQHRPADGARRPALGGGRRRSRATCQQAEAGGQRPAGRRHEHHRLRPRPIAHLPWRLIFLVLRDRNVRRHGPVLGRGRIADALGAQPFRPLLRLPRGRDRHVLHPAADLPRPRLARLWRASCCCWSWCSVLGFVGGGAQRWLDLGFIRLQPSELMKPVIVLAAGRLLRRRFRPARSASWSAIWPPVPLIRGARRR